MNIIDMYVEWASHSCDAPEIYHKTCAYWIISTILGKYANIVTSYTTRGIKPNIWSLLLGPSRIVRKSTAMEMAEGIVEAINPNQKLAASFTPEALYEILNGMQRGDAGYWVKDEFGGFFKMLQKKYMWGMREILSAIYMGRGEKRQLRNLTLVIPSGIYVTTIGTLPTPAHIYFEEEDFSSGFLNRFIIAYAKERNKKIPLLHNDPMLEAKKNEIIYRLTDFENDLKSLAPAVISFSSETAKNLENYDEWIEGELKRIEESNPESLWKLYLAETPNLLLKLCVLRRLGRGDFRRGIIVVEDDDFVKAKEYLDEIATCAREVVVEVQTSPKPRELLTEEKALNKICDIIYMRGNQGVKFSELLTSTSILKSELIKFLETLIDQGKIISIQGKSTVKGGRKPIIFYPAKYEAEVIMYGKKLSSNEMKIVLS